MDNGPTKRHIPAGAYIQQDYVEGKLAQRFDVKPLDLRQPGRRAYIVLVRQMAYYLLRERYRLSYPLIAALYDKDHTTVIYGHNKIKKSEYAAQLSDLLE